MSEEADVISIRGSRSRGANVERLDAVVRELAALSTDRRDLIAWEAGGRLDALVWPSAEPGSAGWGGGAPRDPRSR